MSDTVIPSELERVPANPDFASVLERVFSGRMVAYHPEKALIAVWSGGTGFNVYDPTMWGEHQDPGEVYHFNMPDHSQVDDPEQYARDTLTGYGFEVVG